MRWRGQQRIRRGAVLVYFFMMAFVIMAMAALVVDLGFAILTRRQMQTAVDAAALEGLRFRDTLPPGTASGTPLEDARRAEAAKRVSEIFDDDLDPTNGDQGTFGAGPVFDLTGGIDVGDGFRASQHLGLEDPPVYKPTLQPNLANAAEGDMLSGTYLGGTANEQSTYQRDDFDTSGNDAFLVRMRRTNDFNGLDDIPGVSSGAPTLPYLFGRAALMKKDPNSAYYPRRDGITLRATAIANAQPAKSVGMPHPVHNLPGTAPFVLYLTPWNNLTSATVTVDNQGIIALDGAAAGYAISPQALGVGQDVNALRQATLNTGSLGTLSYVAVISDPSPSAPLTDRVLGFGKINITGNAPVTIAKATTAAITAENATGVFVHPPDVPAAQIAELFQQHDQVSSPLLVPVLAR